MQISALANPSPLGDLSDAAAASGQQNKTAAGSAGRLANRNPNATNEPAAIPATESAPVTLSSSQVAQTVASQPPVYAEIWKNGVKVATVDASGGVSAMNGQVLSNRGAEGGGGILLAARRTAEIAGAIGGEIHIAGQQIDAKTLAMRARLSAAYGV